MGVSVIYPKNNGVKTISWMIWGLVWALSLVSFWLRMNNLENMPGPTSQYILNYIFWMVVIPLGPLAYATVAALILSRQPRHKVGWMCLALSLVVLVEDVAWQYGQRALVYAAGSLPFGVTAAWLSHVATAMIVPPGFLSLVLYFFPNNRLEVRLWKAGVILASVSLAAKFVAAVLQPEINSAYPLILANPTALPSLEPAARILDMVGNAGGLIALVGGAASVVARWRRANGVEQAQIKWLATDSALLIVTIIAIVLAPEEPELVSGLLILLAAVLVAIALPAAIGVAILRYHLWNIDRIIRRTLAYTLVTGLLVMVYFGSVIMLQQFFRLVSGENSRLSVVLSTLAIAALFQPLRQRVQLFIDQRFYRRRYDAARMLSGFSEKARDLVELESLAFRLNEVVQGSMPSSRVGIWIKGLRRPDDASIRHTE